MLKKIIVISVVILFSIYLMGCQEKTLPTTTTTESTTTTTTTTSTTTTSLYTEYDLSSLVGSESILSMTQLNGYLYIATNQKLYKVSTSNPTTAVSSTIVSHNYVSLLAGNINGTNLIVALYGSGGIATEDSFDESLVHKTSEPTGIGVLPGIALYDLTHFYSYNNQQFIKYDFITEDGSGTANVSETGIISLEYASNNYYYACNPTNIYKYGTSFGAPTSLAASQLNNSTNLIGIAYLNPYIWVVDAISKKLYRVVDNL